ncbi:LysM peptidoglycan-binding domain-containing protein [Desertimonas flava]|uniref:LysM peptidoglycan-binding domain-containing protein n=1 Tax=Desertimonas flava TaxID=2064846 RepID=UPI0013C52ADE|nr:LysM peptidoglycan-binding domain-containing protein [Desertimonas flava]
MKRPVLALVVAAVAGPITTPAVTIAAPPPAADVAVVMAASPDDVGFGQAIVDSVNRLQGGGVVADLHITSGLGDGRAAAGEAIESYSAGEFELVVVAGDEFDEQLIDAAVNHPDQHYAWIAAPDAPDFAQASGLPNVAVIVPAAQQGAYVLGELAAAVTPDPAAVTLVSPTGSGIDALFGSGFALGFAAAADGAEVVATPEPAAGATVFAGGPFDMASEAASGGAVVLYTGFDATPFDDRFAAAMVYRLDPSLHGVLDGLAAGAFPAGVSAATVGNEGVTIVIAPGSALPPDALDRAGQTLAALSAGGFDVVVDVPTRVRIGAGETPESVAESLGVSVDQLAEANGLTAAEVTVGAVLQTGLPTVVAAGTPATGARITPNHVGPVGDCQGMGVDTANQWRSELGAPALTDGGLGSCDWARHLAETGTSAHAGDVTEVIFIGQRCGDAWVGWRDSASHYDVIVSADYSVGDFSCIVTADGTAYAVGRLA